LGLWWLNRYSNGRNANGYDSFFGQPRLFGPSRDSTVSAYARQLEEHARLLDSWDAELRGITTTRADVVIDAAEVVQHAIEGGR